MFIKEKHKKWNQIVFFTNGMQRVVNDIVRCEKGEWWHLQTEQGIEYIFPPDKILFIKIFVGEDTNLK